jgi:hypothetical protein
LICCSYNDIVTLFVVDSYVISPADDIIPFGLLESEKYALIYRTTRRAENARHILDRIFRRSFFVLDDDGFFFTTTAEVSSPGRIVVAVVTMEVGSGVFDAVVPDDDDNSLFVVVMMLELILFVDT